MLFSKNAAGGAADRLDHQADDRRWSSPRPSLPLDEALTITQDDVDTEKGSRSRLRSARTLTRGELLHLALMSSENRAAHALGRTLSGRHAGVRRGDEPQGARARHERHALRRADRPVEPQPVERARPGRCWSRRRTSTRCMRELSTSPEYEVEVGNRPVQFRNTNGLVQQPASGRSACRRPATSPRPAAAW